MGLPYPGGPQIDRLAAEGDTRAVRFPRAWLGESLDFSFSGLKTAVRNFMLKEAGTLPLRDVAASYQAAIVEVLAEKLRTAARATGVRTLCVTGGVAANRSLRKALENMAREESLRLVVPAPDLCTDNAAMIAAAGHFSLQRRRYTLDDLAFDTLATRQLDTVC